jgi:glycosyltransferase involved in cell wall biosynthesis
VTPALLHLPTPGDHYSPATGSATMTVIYELARRHELAGGYTLVLVDSQARADYSTGRVIPVRSGAPWPSRAARLADVGLGTLGSTRWATLRQWRPYIDSASALEASSAFVHNGPAAAAELARRRPTYLWAHNRLFRTYSRTELARRVVALAGIIAVSEYLAGTIEQRLSPLRDHPPVYVVRNGVDSELFRPGEGPLDPPIVLFLGRMVPEKGPDRVLRAARRLLKSRRSFRVMMVGSAGFSATAPLTDYERELRRLAAPIAEHVTFQPFLPRPEIPALYQQAAIFCAPSNWDDPCPLTIGEAMASGLAVVTSRRGGIPEVGGDSVTYADTDDELEAALAGLLDDEGQRQAQAHAARRRAVRALDWETSYRSLRRAVG